MSSAATTTKRPAGKNHTTTTTKKINKNSKNASFKSKKKLNADKTKADLSSSASALKIKTIKTNSQKPNKISKKVLSEKDNEIKKKPKSETISTQTSPSLGKTRKTPATKIKSVSSKKIDINANKLNNKKTSTKSSTTVKQFNEKLKSNSNVNAGKKKLETAIKKKPQSKVLKCELTVPNHKSKLENGIKRKSQNPLPKEVPKSKKKRNTKISNKENLNKITNCKVCPLVDTSDSSYYEEDDDETTESDFYTDDSWLTIDDDDEDDFCSGGACNRRSAMNKYNGKGTSSSRSKNGGNSLKKSRNCSGGSCNFRSKSSGNISMDSCGYAWTETAIENFHEEVDANNHENGNVQSAKNVVEIVSESNHNQSNVNHDKIQEFFTCNDDFDGETVNNGMRMQEIEESSNNNGLVYSNAEVSYQLLKTIKTEIIDDEEQERENEISLQSDKHEEESDQSDEVREEARTFVQKFIDLNPVLCRQARFEEREEEEEQEGEEDRTSVLSGSSTSLDEVTAPTNNNEGNESSLKECNGNLLNNTTSNKIPKYKSKFYNAIDGRYVLVLLKTKLNVQGTIKLKLIAGSIDIFGYEPEINESLEIFSPRGYAHLSIKPLPYNGSIDNSYVKNEIISKIDQELLKEFQNNLKSNDWIDLFDYRTDAIILLERNDRKEIEMIHEYMKENIFIDRSIISVKRALTSSETILQCILREDKENQMISDDDVDEEYRLINIDKIQSIKIYQSSKILIIGGKNVGKSTLLRYQINKNIKKFRRILLIDFDIGQSEIFIPQTVSATIIDRPLLGPGYLYSMKPNKSLLFGDINVTLSPKFYIKNIKYLIEYCKKNNEYQNIPWFINTMGYNKGFGGELTSFIMKLLNPTHVFQFEDKSKIANNFDFYMMPGVINEIPKYFFTDEIYDELNLNFKYQNDHSLLIVNSMNYIEQQQQHQRNRENRITPKDKRYEMIIAHCGRILNEGDQGLAEVKPKIAKIDEVDIISLENHFISKTDLLEVINGNFVYLCCRTDQNYFECFGLGVVRGVNQILNSIILIPSVSDDIMKKVDTLVECKIPLPTSLLLNQGPKVENNAPYIYTSNDFIASRHIHQIHYRPLLRNQFGKRREQPLQ